MESRKSADGRAWKVDGRAQALVGPGLATPLPNNSQKTSFLLVILCKLIDINFREESLKELRDFT